MRIEDSRKLIAVLMVTYPNYKPIDTELAAKVWTDATEEYSYEQINMALKAYMKSSTSGFAPTPGQLIDKTYSITQPQELNEMEAWALVSKAIRNSGYHSIEEYAKLPPLVQKAVGLPDSLREWAMTENLNLEVVMSNFQRAYKSELKRHEELQKMPQNVRQLIEKANVGSYSAHIEQKKQQAIESSNERKQGEIKALGMKQEGIPMPEKYKKRLEDMRNE